MAVAQHEQGRIEHSLDTARRAELADPAALLPIVQQAFLHGQLGETTDKERARRHKDRAQKRWQEVVDAAARQGDLAGLLQSVRARVHLEGPVSGAGPPEHEDGAGN
jgi:hypothetical protein